MADQPAGAGGVALAEGQSGSSFLLGLLREAVERFPDAFRKAELPAEASTFRRRFELALPRFEALRIRAPERTAIARYLTRRALESLRFQGPDRSEPLREALSQRPDPGALEVRPLGGRRAPTPAVPYGGREHRGKGLSELADRLLRARRLTRAAAAALHWMAERTESAGLDLSAHRFAILGAAAEIAPTPLLLAAGAQVLWIDVRDPRATQEGDGTLHLAPGARDLLREPHRIAAAIERFADKGPVHLGLFAYAPGRGRELRLAGAMNAIVHALDPALVRSVSLFVSPTTALQVQAQEAAAARASARALPLWQRALAGVGVLDPSAPLGERGPWISRTVVPLQGLAYQAAQYVSKILFAEACATGGTRLDAPVPQPVTVSANVAGITATRSMQHPVFQAAFAGATRFGIEVFAPETTRALSGLLLVHDLLDPQAPGSSDAGPGDPEKRAGALFSQQVHGGLFASPHVTAPALRVAAVLGLLQQPRLLGGLLRGSTDQDPG
jgi:hypothetical protein